MNGDTEPNEPAPEERRHPLQATKGELVFVLKYDEELACLVTEGLVRQAMLPSDLK